MTKNISGIDLRSDEQKKQDTLVLAKEVLSAYTEFAETEAHEKLLSSEQLYKSLQTDMYALGVIHKKLLENSETPIIDEAIANEREKNIVTENDTTYYNLLPAPNALEKILNKIYLNLELMDESSLLIDVKVTQEKSENSSPKNISLEPVFVKLRNNKELFIPEEKLPNYKGKQLEPKEIYSKISNALGHLETFCEQNENAPELSLSRHFSKIKEHLSKLRENIIEIETAGEMDGELIASSKDYTKHHFSAAYMAFTAFRNEVRATRLKESANIFTATEKMVVKLKEITQGVFNAEKHVNDSVGGISRNNP